MTKAPTPAELSKGQNDNTNNVTKKFDYTAVADRIRTVSWSNYEHPTGVVYQVYRAYLPTHHNSCVIEGKNMKIFIYIVHLSSLRGNGDEDRRYHEVKTMAKWPKGIGVT